MGPSDRIRITTNSSFMQQAQSGERVAAAEVVQKILAPLWEQAADHSNAYSNQVPKEALLRIVDLIERCGTQPNGSPGAPLSTVTDLQGFAAGLPASATTAVFDALRSQMSGISFQIPFNEDGTPGPLIDVWTLLTSDRDELFRYKKYASGSYVYEESGADLAVMATPSSVIDQLKQLT
jgi:hypothetical protein